MAKKYIPLSYFELKFTKQSIHQFIIWLFCISILYPHFLSSQDIFKDAIDGNLSSAKDLAYFEGDFWPNVIEESIRELEQEEEERWRREEAEAAAAETQETVEETTDAVHLDLFLSNNYSLSILYFLLTQCYMFNLLSVCFHILLEFLQTYYL